MSDIDFVWTGDLEDDCHCELDGMKAHAERMDEDEWYCHVVDRDGTALMHTSDDDIVPLSGEAARKLCQWVMLANRRSK